MSSRSQGIVFEMPLFLTGAYPSIPQCPSCWSRVTRPDTLALVHPSSSWKIRNVRPEDQLEFYAALDLFAHAFEDSKNYLGQPPSADYVFELLSSPHFFLFVAQQGEEIVGALAGYELQKFEQMRREHYIYDIAVHQDHRRKGIATGLIERGR